LPVVREALIDAMATFQWPRLPLVRVPSDRTLSGNIRRQEWVKRMVIGALTSGLRGRLQEAGFPVNDSFAGFSSFAVGTDYEKELEAAIAGGGRCHLVMSHPGFADAELYKMGDPVVQRREEELRGIMSIAGLPERIWRPIREADGSIDWIKAMAT
jgi:hypothetical protein